MDTRKELVTTLQPRRCWMVGFTACALLALAACQSAPPAATESPSPPAATTAAVTEAAPPPTAAPAADEVAFGPGSFNLPSPNVGLAELTGYRETLTITFDGTQAGQPAQWTRTYVMLANREPAASQVTVETAGDDALSVFVAEVNGALFERRGEAPCTVSVVEAGASLAGEWEPARFLGAVLGAEPAGSETVNNVAADHYTFDERALGAAESADATGELWVAAEGGYLVRYALTVTGGAEYFGEGTEGAAAWDYQLTEVNQPQAITLPADCPAGMVDAPLLPDATGVIRQPGVLHYSTPASLAEAAAFYQGQLSGLGWLALAEPLVSDTSAVLEFTQSDQQLSVILATVEGGTLVTLELGRVQP